MTVKTRARLRNINRRCLLGASQLSVDNLLDFECFIYSWPPIDKVIIESNTSLRFRLKNGLELRESIERTVR